jgi:hypothetical protein
MHGFESVEHELEARRAQLEQELASVRGRMGEIEADLERVHDAMSALTGAKKKSKGKSRAKKPVPSVPELHRHIAQAREENPYADAGALEKVVRVRVQEQGGSLTGFKMLFAEALLSSPGYQGSSAAAHGLGLHEPSYHGEPHGSPQGSLHGPESQGTHLDRHHDGPFSQDGGE